MHSPKVSVIIPVYNISTYLPQCLESLIHQTLAEIEILCVDDASTDGSAQIIEAFQAQDPRIRLLQQTHQGVSAARNLGILHARGTYISFVDGDDWIAEDMLETLLAAAEDSHCDMVICSSEVHFAQQGNLRQHRHLQAALTVAEDIWATDGSAGSVWSLVQHTGSWPFIWNKLIRSDLIKQNSITFSPLLSLGEDGVFLQLLFQYAKKVVFVPNALYHYRYQRKASATDNMLQNEVRRFQQHIAIASVMLREFSDRGLLADQGTRLLQWLLWFLYADFVHLPAANRQDTAAALKQLFSQYHLTAFSGNLPYVQQKRLKNMLKIARPCTKAQRICDIVQTKIENRLIRIFSRK